MSNSEELLEKLAGKITTLTSRYKDLSENLTVTQQELTMLKQENSNLQSKISEQSQSIQNLNSDLEEARNIVPAVTDDKRMEEKVNLLVNEIDECISLLKEG